MLPRHLVEEIIPRIRKLKNLADDPGAYGPERESAREGYERLMKKYKLKIEHIELFHMKELLIRTPSVYHLVALIQICQNYNARGAGIYFEANFATNVCVMRGNTRVIDTLERVYKKIDDKVDSYLASVLVYYFTKSMVRDLDPIDMNVSEWNPYEDVEPDYTRLALPKARPWLHDYVEPEPVAVEETKQEEYEGEDPPQDQEQPRYEETHEQEKFYPHPLLKKLENPDQFMMDMVGKIQRGEQSFGFGGFNGFYSATGGW